MRAGAEGDKQAIPALSALPIARHRHDIDGLRAIAVLAVVVNHLDEAWLPGGFRGVDMFFTISGFVITRSLMGRERTGNLPFLFDFFARRIKRLLPALLLCVALTACLAMVFTTDSEIQLSAGVRAIFGLSNLKFYEWQTDYFANATHSALFIHTWSLGVEEQFYFVFALFWIVLDPRSRWFLPVLMVVSAASLVLYLSWAPSARAFFLLPARFWEIGAGCILAALPASGARRPTLLPIRAVAASIVVLALMFPLPFGGEALAVAGTAALIRWTSPDDDVERFLESSPMQIVGLGSYSLYLWHWPVIAVANWTIGVRWESLPFLLAAGAFLSWASYRFVELPGRRARWPRSAGGTIAAGGIAAAMLYAVCHQLAVLPPFALYVGNIAQLEQRGAESLMTSFTVPGMGSWDGQRCVFGRGSTEEAPLDIAACTFGHGPRVVVLGNSYATALVRGFEPLARSGRSVTVLTALGAAPLPTLATYGGQGSPSGSAEQWHDGNRKLWGEAAPAALESLQPGDAVFLASDLAGTKPSQFAAFESGLRDLSGQVRNRGAKLLVLDGLPFMRDAACKPEVGIPQWFAPFGSACMFYTRAQTLARRAPLTRMFERLEGEGVLSRVDLFDVFCPGSICTFQSGNTVLYRDEYGHPSVEATRLAGPILRDAVLENPDG